MIPFYIFYSMFGFQRTGDQIWAVGDARGRGFLMGATAGRTTLTGEGLQHDDGHSHVLASTVPDRPRLRPGVRLRARGASSATASSGCTHDGEDVFYYITLYNENYPQPPKPDGRRRGHPPRPLPLRRGARAGGAKAHAARLVGSGSILQQVIAARDLLAEQLGIAAEVYSAPSFPLLRRDALEAERWNRLHPATRPRVPVRRAGPRPDGGPIVAATDWMKALPDLVAPLDPGRRTSRSGTDGFGRSDTREALRAYFEIDPPHIAAAALAGLARCGGMTPARRPRRSRAGHRPEKADPLTR